MLKKYSENIKDIVKEINKSTKDIFIIGDNSSGKSDVLKELLIEEKAKGNFYFIDSCNRSFKYNKINFTSNLIPKVQEILDHRLKEENFNIKDSFYTDTIEFYYASFDIERLKELLKDFLSIDFDLKPIGEGLSFDIGLFINDIKYENLSNGYQAIVRIFLELLCATSNKKIDTIIIDEINEFLSVKNEAKIFSFLKKEFPNIRFILTTHSADIIADNEN
ncbi:MAG: AAA family ATPase [Fusobacteriaceae bacterium]